MKNTIYVVVIVVCLILAAVIAYKYIFSAGSSGGIDSIPESEKTWVKCNNPSCKAEYEMGLREYHQQVKERMNPLSMGPTPLICKKCGEESVYQAVKCSNPDCGIVFIRGIVPGGFPDRCPECGRSETEEIRKRRAAGG